MADTNKKPKKKAADAVGTEAAKTIKKAAEFNDVGKTMGAIWDIFGTAQDVKQVDKAQDVMRETNLQRQLLEIQFEGLKKQKEEYERMAGEKPLTVDQMKDLYRVIQEMMQVEMKKQQGLQGILKKTGEM